MNCPNCGHTDHRVLRTDAAAGIVRRTRECLRCGGRWYTKEMPAATADRFEAMAEAWRRMRDAVGE